VPLTIKNPDVERLARLLASETGESLTEAVKHSIEQRLDRIRGSRTAPNLRDAILTIARRCSALPDRDARSIEEILAYDESGTFR